MSHILAMDAYEALIGGQIGLPGPCLSPLSKRPCTAKVVTDDPVLRRLVEEFGGTAISQA